MARGQQWAGMSLLPTVRLCEQGLRRGWLGGVNPLNGILRMVPRQECLGKEDCCAPVPCSRLQLISAPPEVCAEPGLVSVCEGEGDEFTPCLSLPHVLLHSQALSSSQGAL